jgi:hypothetical protein
MAKNRKTPNMNLPVWFDGQNINEAMKILVFYVDKQYFNMVILFLRLRVRRELIIRRDGRAVEGTGLENRRCESIRGFESHSLRQLNFSIDLRKYPRGRRGSPAKGVGRVKSAAEVQILSSAPSKNLEAITVSRFFLFLVKTFLLRLGIVPSVGYIVGDIVVYFTDFVLQLTLLFIILSWAEDSSSSHEIDSVEYRQWLLHVQNTLAFG